MRSEILDLISQSLPEGFSVSERSPFEQNGIPLYRQNFKRVYVDQPQTDQDPLFQLLDGNSIFNETVTISAYVTTDAKTLPTNFDTAVNSLKAVSLVDSLSGYNQKTNSVSTEYNDDSITVRVDYVFVKTEFDH